MEVERFSLYLSMNQTNRLLLSNSTIIMGRCYHLLMVLRYLLEAWRSGPHASRITLSMARKSILCLEIHKESLYSLELNVLLVHYLMLTLFDKQMMDGHKKKWKPFTISSISSLVRPALLFPRLTVGILSAVLQ